MNPALTLILSFFLGLLGGALSIFIPGGTGFVVPHKLRWQDAAGAARSFFHPGYLGHVLIGPVAAEVMWLSGAVDQTSPLLPVAAFVIGLAGAWLVMTIWNALARRTATQHDLPRTALAGTELELDAGSVDRVRNELIHPRYIWRTLSSLATAALRDAEATRGWLDAQPDVVRSDRRTARGEWQYALRSRVTGKAS